MDFEIRNYHPSDFPHIYNICLKTGASGKDATNDYTDPLLIGQFFAAAYPVFEPGLTFMLTGNSKPIGYILGTSDSQKFYQFFENEWLPILRKQYPAPDENDTSRDAFVQRKIHEKQSFPAELMDYPAHLHIDILPEGQGQGFGGKMMNVFMNKLREMNIKALHLQVGKKNEAAIKFYERRNFHIIADYGHSFAMGIIL